MNSIWTRRQWLAAHVPVAAALVPMRLVSRMSRACHSDRATRTTAVSTVPSTVRLDLAPWQALARQAVEAAHTAGAQYAEARLTRQVTHGYRVADGGKFERDEEVMGVGVRALVGGGWGFSASTVTAADEVVRLAQDAVGQAREAAKGVSWTVDLGQIPVATGSWITPVRIDPFTVPIEEKLDYIGYMGDLLNSRAMKFYRDGIPSYFRFFREERVVATSEGALFTQTFYESMGEMILGDDFATKLLQSGMGKPLNDRTYAVPNLGLAAAGWELILDAKIPEQVLSGKLLAAFTEARTLPSKPFTIGKYPLVFDGAAMARLLEKTLGVATQLDRALGYEANARGTSFLDNPLGMLGQAAVASPAVTVTANRSAPRQVATVKWDDEGVAPEPFPLIKDGVLVDFQTTREQAAWLAPYYAKTGQPVRSHGCAASESAQDLPIQHMPNLALAPSAAAIELADLVADVKDGILVEGGQVLSSDSQARTGMFLANIDTGGRMRQIKNGRLGPILDGGAVIFDTQNLWKHLHAVGGSNTEQVVASSRNPAMCDMLMRLLMYRGNDAGKGEPPQFGSHSVQAAAATLPPQAVVNPVARA